MKPRLLMIFFVVLLAADVHAEATLILKTQSDSLNYAFGVEMARNLKRQGVEVNPDALVKGLQDGLSGEGLLLSERDLRKAIIEFQAGQKLKRTGMRKNFPADNKMKSYSSLGENKSKDGVESQPNE